MLTVAAVLGAAGAAAVGSRGARSRRLALAAPAGSRRVVVVLTVVCTVVVAGELRLSPWIVVATGCVAALAASLLRRRTTVRRRAALEVEVVTLGFAVAAELRAGRMPADALGSVVSQLGLLAPGIDAAARAVARGAAVDDELAAFADALDSPRLHAIAAVWAAAADTGAGVAGVLERVARSFAADDEARAELDALAAGPRATATVLCALPLFAVGLGTAVGAAPLTMLLHTSLGWLLTAAATVLDGCGLLWVRVITTRALGA